MKFYTTGYAGKSVADLPLLLDRLNAVLADIRFAPHSKSIEWTKDYLSLMLKTRYKHVGALGNRAYETPGEIKIHNLELGIRLIEGWQSDVVIMCGCGDYETCHRRVVAEELVKRGHRVEDLTKW